MASSDSKSTWLRPVNQNEPACLQKGHKPIRIAYTEQPLTTRILVDGSKTVPVDDLIREFFSLHRMLLSKIHLDNIDVCLLPHCDRHEITVDQLSKLNGHQEPVLLLTARSNSDYLLVRDLEELTFRQETGLNVDISIVQTIQQENERLRDDNRRQQERIMELERQLTNLDSIREQMEHMCAEHKIDMKTMMEKHEIDLRKYYKKIECLDEKINRRFDDIEQSSTRLKSD